MPGSSIASLRAPSSILQRPRFPRYLLRLAVFLLCGCWSGAFAPPGLGDDHRGWESVHEYRRTRGLSFDYDTRLVSEEICKHLSEEECRRIDEAFLEQARSTRNITLKQHFLKPLVIPIQWEDQSNRSLVPRSDLEALWNADGYDADVYPTGSIRTYLETNSYGNLVIEATVVDWKIANGTEAYFADLRAGRPSNQGPSLQEAFHHVLDRMEEEGFPFDEYDSDGDGILDSVVFMHSGYGAEYGRTDCSTGRSWEERIWSHSSAAPEEERWVSASTGVRLGVYAIAPVFRGRCNADIVRLGILTHEFLHTLGLPDLYDTEGPYDQEGYGVGGLGAFDLMSNPRGAGNRQAYPGSLSPWSKLDMGWIDPIRISENGTFVARPSQEYADIFIIEKHYSPGEYLLIENRQPIGFDSKLWTGGILVYHIDETREITGNRRRGFPGARDWPISLKHYPVALLQSDGQYHLEKATNDGGVDDFFRFSSQKLGPGNGESVASTEGVYPNTDSYASGIRVTGIVIDNFREVETTGTWSFRVGFPDEVPTAAPTACADRVTVDLKTDQFSTETHWDIRDSSGTVVLYGGRRTSADPGTELSRNTQYSWTECLPEEDYVFTIYDQGGDGMCCGFGEGWWKLFLNDEEIGSGGAFQRMEEISFTTREDRVDAPVTNGRVFQRLRRKRQKHYATALASPIVRERSLPPAIRVPSVLVTKTATPVLLSSETYSSVVFTGVIDPSRDTVSMSVSEGRLTLARSDGLQFVSGSGNGASFAFLGTTESVNAALDGMVYTPGRSFAGRASVLIEISGSQSHARSFHITVNQEFDPEEMRDRILNGVSQIHSGFMPGHLVAFGPTAYDINMYPGNQSKEGPMLAAATMGSGRVVAMPDHQMLNAGQYGEESGTFYINAIEWLAKSTSRAIRILTYDADSAIWLSSQGFSNVYVSSENRLMADLADLAPDVFVGGWIGSDEPADNLEALRIFTINGGGLFLAEYGEGYYDTWWTSRNFHEAPGNLLLREAGIGFGDGFKWDYGLLDASIRASGIQTKGDVILDMLDNPSAYTEEERGRGAFAMQILFECLPPGDPVLSALDDAVDLRIKSIRLSPQNPLSDGFSKALLKREGTLLLSKSVDDVSAHRDADSIFGRIPDDAARITTTVQLDTSRGRWHPTGLYAVAGEVVSVSVPQSFVGKGFRIRINAHTDDISNRDDQWLRPPIVHRHFIIDATKVRVASAFGGPIFIDFGGGEFDSPAPNLGLADIEISNAVEHPFFVVGEHSDEEWVASLRDKLAPYAVFVCRDLIFVQPAWMSTTLTKPTELMDWWQEVMDLQDSLAAYSPGSRTSPELINVDVQISYGAAHAGYPIQAFQKYWNNFADYDTLAVEGSWGDFHEIGHNHQRDWWTFREDGEVTVNIFSTYCLETLTPNSKVDWKWTLGAKETMQRAINAIDSTNSYKQIYNRLPFWRQLMNGFGFDAMREVFATYEEDNMRDRNLLPTTESEKKDQLLVRYSMVVGFDLTDFMVGAWKLEVSQTAIDVIEQMNLEPWMPAVGGIEGDYVTNINTPITFDLEAEALSLDDFARITVDKEASLWTLNDSGTYTYTPPKGFVGIQTLTYTVWSSTGHPHVSTLKVTVLNPIVVDFSKNPGGINGEYYPAEQDIIAGRTIWERSDTDMILFYCQEFDMWMFTYDEYRQYLIDNPSCGSVFASLSGRANNAIFHPWEYDWDETGAVTREEEYAESSTRPTTPTRIFNRLRRKRQRNYPLSTNPKLLDGKVP